MVTPNRPSTQPLAAGEPGVHAALTIGDLAGRTGVTPATLRMWESRHGFPTPQRLDSGHRRYTEGDVELVRQVLRRRDAGVRLDVAIEAVALAEAAAEEPPGAPSVYAALRRRHPALQPLQLKKSTLTALSWAIEDECCARAASPVIFGAFQKERYYRAAEERWAELARSARWSMVFADFADFADFAASSGATRPPGGSSHPDGSSLLPSRPASGRTVLVDLPADAPMRREWAVVCDAPDHPAVLAAWELPGQSSVSDMQRVFESIWTVEPAAVRQAARACAQLARQLGHAEATALLDELADDPPEPPRELRQVASLLNRVVAYVDRIR